MSPRLLSGLVAVLDVPQPRYAGGRLVVAPAKSAVSRAYARFWQKLPFVARGVTGAGLFAVNAAGRARWGEFPQIISDDTFARLQFTEAERFLVDEPYEWPLVEGFSPLVRVRRRQDQGVAQIAQMFPELPARQGHVRPGRAELMRLAAADPLEHETGDMDDAALMAALGHPGQHPEGRFLPETYAYQRGDSDLDILRRAHVAMAQALDEAWQARADDVPLATPDEALVLASIVEKETGQAHERPQIAGVFARRLRKGMLLQTDPTVIYGLGSGYDGNIRKRDLTTDTPYNTYTRVGLPPTPIAMPGRAALQAAVNPAPGDALFFVSRNDGSHVFSATYAEHNAAVDCYQRRRNCPPGMQSPAPRRDEAQAPR